MQGTRVLIAGASIAGPALAHWLTRYGASVTVVEKASQLRAGGQLVDLRGVSREVLKRMGIDKQVRAAAEANYGLSFVDKRNRRRGTLHADDFGGDGPIAEIEILRGELSRVIVEKSAGAIEYRFGDRIAQLSNTPNGVDVTFGSGTTERFDLVVGADGVHSELRDQLFPRHQQRLDHLGVYLAFWTAENHLGIEDWTVAYSEPGRTIGMRSILGNTKTMAFMSFRGGPPSYDHRDVETQKRIALARASGMGWEAAQLLSQINTADDFYFDTCTQVKLPTWSKGRIALLGDAAYCASPLSGHGTTIAMVGAYVLAGELSRSGGDHRSAFALYESKFRPWVEEIQASALGQGKIMTPETALGIRFRGEVSRLSRFVPNKSVLYRGQIRMSNGFALEDYSAHRQPAL